MPDTDSDNQVAPEAISNSPQASAPASEPISTPATPEVADAKQDSTPISSGAGDQDANKKPTSLLDAVKSAVQKTAADAASSTVETNGASASEAKPPQPSLDDKAKDKAGVDADQKLPFHNHPRWKEVVAERDAYRTDAGEYRKITGFMSNNGLSNEEVVEGFQIMALMKINPAEAHKKISEYKARLDAIVGEVLPEDLSEKVRDGFIDPDTAKELAALKAQQKLAEQRQEQAIQDRDLQVRKGIHSAVVNWEQQMKVKDPDWSAKQEMVTDQVRLMLSAEQPSTPEQALALVERAHSIIRERLSRFAPRRQPVSHVASSTSSANATVVPQSLKEAVMRGMLASR
jgi:hypothetical protein